MWPNPLPYHPSPGEVLQCDYAGMIEPEMVKRRWVVVVSPRLRDRTGLCSVVPLSTSAPRTVCTYHVKMEKDPAPNGTPGKEVWAKCDMAMTVSFARLSAYWDGKNALGKRNYIKIMVSDVELKKIRKALLHSYGLGHLWL